jgi:hypothetical protein
MSRFLSSNTSRVLSLNSKTFKKTIFSMRFIRDVMLYPQMSSNKKMDLRFPNFSAKTFNIRLLTTEFCFKAFCGTKMVKTSKRTSYWVTGKRIKFTKPMNQAGQLSWSNTINQRLMNSFKTTNGQRNTNFQLRWVSLLSLKSWKMTRWTNLQALQNFKPTKRATCSFQRLTSLSSRSLSFALAV